MPLHSLDWRRKDIQETVALQLSIGLMTTHSDWLEAPTNQGCFRAFYHHFRHMLGITQR
jgi:hypothetical protein